MKNQKTMYLLAKAKAINEGPKTYRMFTGYALTRGEVKRLYTGEGFTKPDTFKRHIDIWVEVGWIMIQPVGPNKEDVFFFTLDDSNVSERGYHMELRTSHPECEEDLPGVLYA